MGPKQSATSGKGKGKQSLRAEPPEGGVTQASASQSSSQEYSAATTRFRVGYINPASYTDQLSLDFGVDQGSHDAELPTFQLDVTDPNDFHQWTVKTPWSEYPFLLANAQTSSGPVPLITPIFAASLARDYAKLSKRKNIMKSQHVAKTLVTALMATNSSYQALLTTWGTWEQPCKLWQLQGNFFGEYDPPLWPKGVSPPEAVKEEDCVDRQTVTNIVQSWMGALANDAGVSQVAWAT